MRHLALTGGIGSGKSTVAEFFADHGATIIDADAISRELMEPGQPVLDQVAAAFGQHLLDETGRLDRQALANIVFNDDDARQQLNGIVHPAVRAESARLREAALATDAQHAVIIEDIPLLIETGQAQQFDEVIVVNANYQTRLQRLVDTRGMDAADAKSRIAAQATDDQRRAVADWCIDNSGTLDETRAQVATVWSKLTSNTTSK